MGSPLVSLLLNSSREHEKGHQELHLLTCLSVEISHWESGGFPLPCRQTDSELGVSPKRLEEQFGIERSKDL